ncbi:hypothetical protein [Pseudomonas sp. R16(2017)]|uniref:hypothetical protein n=2 Tax=Pseudomonas TaxID=286 RepID=UPI000A1F76B7|nr:hypothetical protein [Pseudomonas sp. R16(2017)]
MLTQDFELVQKVFELVEAGIVHGYDAFRYNVEWGGNYMETELAVEKDGSENWSAETDFNISKIYALVEQLHGNATARGEPWASFVLSYREGEQVKINFTY